MARATVQWLWTLFIVVAMGNGANGNNNIGVNWGNMASQPLPPPNVVGMLKDNGLNKVKLFDADSSTLNALAGTGIEVMVAIPNDMLSRMNTYRHAKDWVKKNVTKHLYNGGVNIRYVAVGNEPLLASYNDSFKQITLPALQNIAKALEGAGHGDIKVSVPLNADVYESSSTVPSSGDFRGDVKDLMLDIVAFLKEKGSPFIVNIYPFLSLYQNPNFPEDFAFFDGNGKSITDNSRTYNNVFDANFDTLVWALKKNGYGDLKIVIGEIGWPTDGHIKANNKYAKKFYDGLLKKLAANKGTPMRSGPLEAYLFGLLDENTKSIDPGDFERHWGIFRYDGQPKFPMDLNGKDNTKKLIGAKGVQYMESKWCIFNTNATNQDNISASVDYACSMSDCTSLGYGSSCNDLDVNGNISYAYNMYFQMNEQSVEACDFDGLATITSNNASQPGCLFPIEVVSSAIKHNIVPTHVVLLSFMLMLLVLL
ncbi:glucan endo-1,3-beta-glucosidase 8-like [Spinacia oleracea]|uniref:glucan endo-1,3-beta-D-glucosidase n=1 Tax=Spinacia oleracea TaxID=3562 RepID=A0A9R0KD14_SPIOL|nr:glucan endo-1,3-beta-glucosidase 8-like [Spinacia oleracea]